MFMERLVGNITLHQPAIAPGVVLTLGMALIFELRGNGLSVSSSLYLRLTF